MVRPPTQKELYNPTLQALHNLGGSGANREIYDEAIKIVDITDEQLAILRHKGGGGIGSTVVGHLIAWALTHLKMYGVLENPRRGFWALTKKGRSTRQVDPDHVQRTVAQILKEKREQKARRTQKESVSPFSVEATTIFDSDEDKRKRMTQVSLPTTKGLYDPTLQALHNLGGSGTIHQINAEVANLLQLAEKQRRGHRASLRRARSHLKIYGLLENPRDRFWTLTEKGRSIRQVDADDVQRVRRQTVEQGIREKNDSPVSAEATAIFDGDEDKKMKEVKIPTYQQMMNPTLQALHNLGGSGTNQEIDAEVTQILNLTDEQLEVLLNPGKSDRTIFVDRMSWARTYLKKVGLLENPRRRFWALTEEGRSTGQVDPDHVRRAVQQMAREKREQKARTQEESDSLSAAEAGTDDLIWQGEVLAAEDVVASLSGWRDELSDILHEMSATAFERFFLRIFRESGIGKVEVTGSSGDDTIEGMMESVGFLSFRVLFRCMRGNRLISTGEVADFRRAVSLGRANKGLLVTTGNFTQEAHREASRGGAPEIDLMDGEKLIDKLKELSLGVKTEKVVVERVIIDRDWFQNIQL